jgi:hypothetical protein
MADEIDLDEDDEYQEVEGQLQHMGQLDDEDLVEVDTEDLDLDVTESRGTWDDPSEKWKKFAF